MKNRRGEYLYFCSAEQDSLYALYAFSGKRKTGNVKRTGDRIASLYGTTRRRQLDLFDACGGLCGCQPERCEKLDEPAEAGENRSLE